MQKSPILSPDTVVINTPYTFTVNPNDDFQYFSENTDSRIKKSTNHINHILSLYNNLRIILNMDISRTGRIHWHGTITFPSEMSIKIFYFEIIHELLTKHQIEMDTIADPHKWTEYCTKLKNWLNIKVSTETSSKKLSQALKKSEPSLHKDITTY